MDGFQVGDVVHLKSGGPRMTVEEIKENCVKCACFDKEDGFKYQINDAMMFKKLVSTF